MKKKYLQAIAVVSVFGVGYFVGTIGKSRTGTELEKDKIDVVQSTVSAPVEQQRAEVTEVRESKPMFDSPLREESDTVADRQLSKHREFLEWAENDPKDALLNLIQNEDISKQRHLYEAVISKWVQKDPNQFFSSLSMFGDTEMQLELTEMASSVLGADFPDSGLSILEQFLKPTGTDRAVALNAFYASMAQEHPERVKEELAYMPAGPLRISAMVELAESMAKKDSLAALTWYQSLDPSVDNSAVFSTLVDSLVSQHPQQAEQLLAGLSTQAPEGNEYYDLAMALAKTKGDANFYDAVEWADEYLKDDYTYHTVLDQVSEEWISKDPLASLKEVVTWEDEEMRKGFLNDIASSDAFAESFTPEEASSVLELFPDAESRSTAVGNMVLGWFDSNPETVASWIETIDDSSTKEMAIVPYVENLAQYSESEARKYIAGLQDPALQARLNEEIFNQE